MKKFMMSILMVLILGLTLITATGFIGATSVVISGEAGTTVTGSTTVTNTADADLTLAISEVRLVGESDSSFRIPRDAITISPDDFDLDDGESRTVSITVDIPDGIAEQLYSGEFTITDGAFVETTFGVFVDVQDRVVTGDPFVIEEIEVSGVEVTDSDQIIHVERGDDVDIRIEFSSGIDSDRVRVKAWIGGFEFGDVQDRTGIFTVEKGLIYSKFLTLEIPNDIDLDDDEFRLHIEIFDNQQNAEITESFKLGIRKERHNLEILDVIFFPSNTVEAGRALRAVVRVENLGEQKEEDILVKVSIPELGVSAKTFIDELVSDEEFTRDDDEETSESSDELVLFIPRNANSGEYLVEIEVEFNRGHDSITEKRTILVEGREVVAETKALISVDMTSQNIAQGQEVPYKFMIANLGNVRTLYSVEVDGTGGWAASRVSPSFVSVDQGEAGEVFVFVKVNENAPIGQQNFKVNILADGIKVKEVNLNANIVENGVAVAGSGFQNTQRALEVIFVILVVALVILGLVIAFRRTGKAKEASEPETVEGQTYY